MKYIFYSTGTAKLGKEMYDTITTLPLNAINVINIGPSFHVEIFSQTIALH